MKAILATEPGGPEALALIDREPPVPARDQVLIRVVATSVNRPDIIQREGNYPPPAGDSDVLGLECAGIVEATGTAVDPALVGKRVFALLGGGGYAEYATAHWSHVIEIPAAMDFSQAACIAETWITAWSNLFEQAGLVNGETVLIHGGSSGVGTAAIQLVRALRPDCRIIATASAGKLERIGRLGAEAIDYRAADFAQKLAARIGRSGVDVILDHIGAANLRINLKSLAIGGRLLIIGIMGGSEAQISLGRLMVKRQRIIGSVLRSRPKEEKSVIIENFRENVMPLFAQGLVAPVIDSRFALADVAAAHRRMESGEHFGKIVLTVQH